MQRKEGISESHSFIAWVEIIPRWLDWDKLLTVSIVMSA